ncbi:hypothetical protein OIV83_000990 [Microbotryomycetes sp. JL201]|nr:hypothetical protein OIV83_000990 [Microbotryomycetes sp. JL201]
MSAPGCGFATDVTNTPTNGPTKRRQRERALRQSQLSFAPVQARSSSASPLCTRAQTSPSTTRAVTRHETPVTPPTTVESTCNGADSNHDAHHPGDTSPLAAAATQAASLRSMDVEQIDSTADNDESDGERDTDATGSSVLRPLKRVRRRHANDYTPLSAWHAYPYGPRKIDSLFTTTHGVQMSALEAMKRRDMGATIRPRHLSMRPILRDYVSHNEEQVHRLPSQHEWRNFAPPFVTEFSNGAKAGRKQLLAVADEEGVVTIFDAGGKTRHDADSTRTAFSGHHNAIFDLNWSADDSMIVTASGDQSARLFNVETQQCLAVLEGHVSTIKSVRLNDMDEHTVATASRDGSIRIWDIRVHDRSTGGVSTVNLIKNAHGERGKGGARSRTATRSVTAISYLPQSSNLLASAGSADSVIKVWDLRRSHSKRVNPASVEDSEDWASNTDSIRSHGISNMAIAPNGRRLYALCKDFRIYAFDPFDLTRPEPLGSFSDPRAQFNTFYIRLAVSPCSRYIASGSSQGSLFLWDAEGSGRDAVRVQGHEKEVSGLSWAHDRVGLVLRLQAARTTAWFEFGI